jgi:hypothetical protein
MLTNHPTTTAALSLSLLSLFFGLAFTNTSRLVSVNADSISYTTDLANGIWTDADGNLGNSGSYSKAPFVIDEGEHRFLFSAGFIYNAATPYFGSHNAYAVPYHDFDHPRLTPFRDLTNGRNAVLVLNDSLINAKITSMVFSTTYVANAHQYIDMIYSLNDGLSWHLAATPSGYTRDGLTIHFNHSIAGNRLRIGIMSRYDYATYPYRYLVNPTLSFTISGLDAVEEASAFASLVEIYTPCDSDIDGLTLVTQDVANNLKDQYQRLSAAAKTIFDNSEISLGNRHLDRLNFLLHKHSITLNYDVSSIHETEEDHNYQYAVFPVVILGIMGYVITKRKPQ